MRPMGRDGASQEDGSSKSSIWYVEPSTRQHPCYVSKPHSFYVVPACCSCMFFPVRGSCMLFLYVVPVCCYSMFSLYVAPVCCSCILLCMVLLYVAPVCCSCMLLLCGAPVCCFLYVVSCMLFPVCFGWSLVLKTGFNSLDWPSSLQLPLHAVL